MNHMDPDHFDTDIQCEEVYEPTAADWAEFGEYLDSLKSEEG